MAEITITATDGAGTFKAYVAEPKRKPAGAVVVIQEVFGVNDSLKETANDLAAQGYIAIAPDLFWRQEPGVNITDKSEAEWKKAFALMNGFDQDKGIEDLKATLAAARRHPGGNGKAATIGYCLGGRLAFMMALRADAEANIAYYGVGLDNLVGEAARVKAPLLVHIAAEDEFVPPPVQEAVLAGAKGHERIRPHVYPGVQHAFARVGGVHFDARAAAIANGRTAELLASVLG